MKATQSDSAVTRNLRYKEEAQRAMKEMVQCLEELRFNEAFAEYMKLYELAEDIDLPLMNPQQSQVFCAMESLRRAINNE